MLARLRGAHTQGLARRLEESQKSAGNASSKNQTNERTGAKHNEEFICWQGYLGNAEGQCAHFWEQNPSRTVPHERKQQRIGR